MFVHAEASCGIRSQNKESLVDGKLSKVGGWPWLVAVFHSIRQKFICGGSLISEKLVLTVSKKILNCR